MPYNLAASRREEIIAAYETLSHTMGFKDITIKEIGAITSFTRTSIYNYFHTKEEIYLTLLQREFDAWANDLGRLLRDNERLPSDELANALAHSLDRRELMLKLISVSHFDMENDCREELMSAVKASYGSVLTAIQQCLTKFRPQMLAADRQTFQRAFFTFLYGIFPYTSVSESQRLAMERADVNYVYQSIYELSYAFLIRFLN